MNKTVLLWLALMLFSQFTHSQESDVGDINNLLDDFHHVDFPTIQKDNYLLNLKLKKLN